MNKSKKKIDNRVSINFKKQLEKVEIGIKNGVFIFSSPLSITEFSTKINKTASEILKFFFLKGQILNINSILSEEQIGEFCLENNLDFEKKKEINEINILSNLKINDEADKLSPRPPIVTIMGHVDHGKTTLLDYIRKTKNASNEVGGITQHIGAYQIDYKKNKITFIDTPGHAAFTKIRARGANITDIVVLVVAADDGIKEQTKEAINHAKAANVPIIVFINKMDKPNANPEVVMSQLSTYDLTPEEWGGETIVVKGSALSGNGVDKLLDNIVTLGEINEIKANPNRTATGTVIESKFEKGLGPVATVIVTNGTLKKNDFIIVGSAFGKIRLLIDEDNKKMDYALPSQPVKIIGLDQLPEAGQNFVVDISTTFIKDISEKIKQESVIERLKQRYESNNVNNEESDNKCINIILKTDTHGSLEAVSTLLKNINVNKIKLTIIHSAVGEVSETDVQLARASKPPAIIVCFNVFANNNIKKIANNFSIKILNYDIIYKLSEEIEKILKNELEPEYVEEATGIAIVRQIWSHSKIGKIAGCFVENGEIHRSDYARIFRNEKEIANTKIISLRHIKENINKISANNECGIVLNNIDDLNIDDKIKCYKLTLKQNA